MFIRLMAMVVTSMVALTSFAVADKATTDGKEVVPNCVKSSSCTPPVVIVCNGEAIVVDGKTISPTCPMKAPSTLTKFDKNVTR